MWKEETEFSPRGFDKLEEVKRKERAWFRKVGNGSQGEQSVSFDTIECMTLERLYIKYLE